MRKLTLKLSDETTCGKPISRTYICEGEHLDGKDEAGFGDYGNVLRLFHDDLDDIIGQIEQGIKEPTIYFHPPRDGSKPGCLLKAPLEQEYRVAITTRGGKTILHPKYIDGELRE